MLRMSLSDQNLALFLTLTRVISRRFPLRKHLSCILETIIAQRMPRKLSLLSSDQINPKIITVHNSPVYIQISIQAENAFRVSVAISSQ